MAKGKPPPFRKKFEQSRFDKEKPGVKEGSKEDMALDRRQMAAMGPPAPPFMRKGGKVGRK